jgi:hypothetical protein
MFLIVLKYKCVDIPITGTSLNYYEHIFKSYSCCLNPQHVQ